MTADKLRLGYIITFDHFDQTTTHRIVGVEGSANGTMFSTKGDANQVTDPEPLTFPGRVGLVKLEEPASHLAAAGADGEQMEELLVLPGGAVQGQQVLQGVGVEVPVLHSILLTELL